MSDQVFDCQVCGKWLDSEFFNPAFLKTNNWVCVDCEA